MARSAENQINIKLGKLGARITNTFGFWMIECVRILNGNISLDHLTHQAKKIYKTV